MAGFALKKKKETIKISFFVSDAHCKTELYRNKQYNLHSTGTSFVLLKGYWIIDDIIMIGIIEQRTAALKSQFISVRSESAKI